MLTFINVINYLTGKYVSKYILILITIAIYYILIKNYWNNIYNNKIYLSLFILLLIIDITTIYIIFFYDYQNITH
jgi:hypothetical protein